MCKLIKVDGTETEVTPANGKYWEIEELQKMVGGYIETFPTPDPNITMVLHEEGKLQKFPKLNVKATALIHTLLMAGDWICGDIVLTRKDTLDGDEGEE